LTGTRCVSIFVKKVQFFCQKVQHAPACVPEAGYFAAWRKYQKEFSEKRRCRIKF